jgi:predicted RNA polymerase sigma factor
VPDNPRSWLLTVASRRLVDQWRSESARRRREETAAALEAVRAYLLERAGELAASRDSYRKAARMTASIPEQRYLALKAARLVD